MFENINIPQVMRWFEIIGQQLYYWLLFSMIFTAIIVLPKYILSLLRYIAGRIALYIWLFCVSAVERCSLKVLRLPFLSAFRASPDLVIRSGYRNLRITLIDDVFAFRSVVTVKSEREIVITSIDSKPARKAAAQGDTYIITGSVAQGEGTDRRKNIKIAHDDNYSDILLISPAPLAFCVHKGNHIEPFYEPVRVGHVTVCGFKMFRDLMR